MSEAGSGVLHLNDGDAGERKISWLELFYDLIYVTIIIQLGDFLSEEVSLTRVLLFALLFLPVWWSWTGMMFYFNRFVVDDLWHRLLVFAQMFAIAFMAIGVTAAFGSGDATFALAYFAVRMILVLLYLRAWRFVPSARPLIGRYALGFTVAASFWAASAFVPAPYRYLLWLVGLGLEFWVPLSAGSRRLQSSLPPDRPHMAERYGLFTIIVLGESFIKVVGTLGGQGPTPGLLLLMALGFGVTAGLWWVYFSLAQSVGERLDVRSSYVWIYSHLPIAMGITAVGVGLTKVVVLDPTAPIPGEYRWLLAGALALILAAAALLVLATGPGTERSPARGLAAAGALLVVLSGLLGSTLPAWLTLTLFLTACVGTALSRRLVEPVRTTAPAG